MNNNRVHPDDSQLVYSRVLHWTSTFGIAFVAVAFAVYVFELLPLKVSIQDIVHNWHLGAGELNQTFKLPTGWGWISDILKGDILSFASIVYISGVTIICLAAVIAVFLEEKNMIYAIIAILQILVLVVAASGFVGAGH